MTTIPPDEPVCEMCGNFPPTDLNYALANMLGNWCPSCGHPHGTGHKPASPAPNDLGVVYENAASSPPSPAASPVLEPAQDAQDGGYERCRYLTCIRPMNHNGEHHLGYEPVPEAGSVRPYGYISFSDGLESTMFSGPRGCLYVAATDYAALLARCEKAEHNAEWRLNQMNSLEEQRTANFHEIRREREARLKAEADRDRLATRVGALTEALRILADFPIEQHQHRGTPGAPLYGFNNWLLMPGHVYNARVAINIHDWGGPDALSHKDPAT